MLILPPIASLAVAVGAARADLFVAVSPAANEPSKVSIDFLPPSDTQSASNDRLVQPCRSGRPPLCCDRMTLPGSAGESTSGPSPFGASPLSMFGASVFVVSQAPVVDRASPRIVRQVPAGPGSARLFVSAVVMAGAWNLVRTSARHLHLGRLAAIPEWYSLDGPNQVGHAVPFDLQFSAPPVVFPPHAVSIDTHVARLRRWHDLARVLRPQSILTRSVPRAPPS